MKVTVHGRPVAVRDPEAARDAVAALFANRVVALTKLDGVPDLVIEVGLNEGAPPNRIACRPVSTTERPERPERYCSVDGVNATFTVAAARLAPLASVEYCANPRGKITNVSWHRVRS